MEDFLSSEEERERAWRGLPSMIGSRLQFEGRREPTTDCRLLEALDVPLALSASRVSRDTLLKKPLKLCGALKTLRIRKETRSRVRFATPTAKTAFELVRQVPLLQFVPVCGAGALTAHLIASDIAHTRPLRMHMQMS